MAFDELHAQALREAARLRKALENLVAECRTAQSYVSGEASSDEADAFHAALKEAKEALAVGVGLDRGGER